MARTERLELRVSPTEREALQAWADARGCTVAEALRVLIGVVAPIRGHDPKRGKKAQVVNEGVDVARH